MGSRKNSGIIDTQMSAKSETQRYQQIAGDIFRGTLGGISVTIVGFGRLKHL